MGGEGDIRGTAGSQRSTHNLKLSKFNVEISTPLDTYIHVHQQRRRLFALSIFLVMAKIFIHVAF